MFAGVIELFIIAKYFSVNIINHGLDGRHVVYDLDISAILVWRKDVASAPK